MSKHAIIVVDLGYGDSGKGSIVDALTHRYKAHTVVRYNGGAQAAHTVVTPDGKVHTFAQWGSGTFHQGVRTYLSEFMLVDPLALLYEEAHLRSVGVTDAFERMYIDEGALMITPFARSLNRLREYTRGGGRHGSCGMGIGETVEDAAREGSLAIRMGDLLDQVALSEKLERQRTRMRALAEEIVGETRLEGSISDEWELLSSTSEHSLSNILESCMTVKHKAHIVARDWSEELFRQDGVVIFEGAQGVLIDQKVGFAPYTTWSDTTTRNATSLLARHAWDGNIATLGVLRAYSTRHGPGPFVSEDSLLTKSLPDPHNVWNDWQREFRVGWFDAVASRYALAATGGVDALAITNLDRMTGFASWSLVTHYQFGNSVISDIAACGDTGEQLTQALMTATPTLRTIEHIDNTADLVSLIEQELGTPVAVMGVGAAFDKKVWKQEITAL